ncbi:MULTISPECIES: hypothetical protein [unclassified Streptomyces]|uniref:hypothetical protein n=1 Tax=unclassified Streptomyces TaxID=2593676 RepID=UPI00093D32D8|nr:hypothetical protein [Streptomyces sp. CB01883]
MTIATSHPYTATRPPAATAPGVTAGIGRPGTPPPAPTVTGPRGHVYTVTAYLNAAPDHFRGYRPGQAVAEATGPDGAPLRLTFALARASSVHQAAAAAFYVGNRHTSDDHGQHWPPDVRPLARGDVLRITAPDGSTHHLALALPAFATVAPPTDHLHLAATTATSRRAFCWQPGNLKTAGTLIAYLIARNTAFDHPCGTGATTTLRLHLPGGRLLARPGEWLVHADSDHWQVVTAHAFANGRPS